MRRSVDKYCPGHIIPSCQIELVWVNKEEYPKRLSYKLHITGVKPHDTYIRVSRNPSLQGQVVKPILVHKVHLSQLAYASLRWQART